MTQSVHLGVSDHLGWAVVVAVDHDGVVVDRRRIELVEPHLPAAPVHHLGGAHEMHHTGDRLTDAELVDVVTRVRHSAERMTLVALEQLATSLGAVRSLSLRTWPDDFPTDIAAVRVPPYESRADPVMYREVLAAAAHARGWAVHRFDAKAIQRTALDVVDSDDDDPLGRPRAPLGAPWTNDHRLAYAAALVARADARP